MWEIAKFTSHKQSFMRRTVSFVIAILLAIIFVFLFNTRTVSAADASWTSTNSITYNDNTYNGPADETINKKLGLDESSQAFTYVEPALDNNAQSGSEPRKIHIIYFEPGVELATAINAKYKTYTYISASEFIDPSSETNITVDTAQATTSPQTSSCDVSHGVGWIICPITNFLAEGMDFAYKTLSDFLFVRPTSNDQNSALFRAWSYMRNIANVAFVIVFLIVIYSQLTNFGVSNYGLKKLLPRLIIAAILVNLSYYICAIAIDASNILGYSLQDLFIWIRNGLVGTTGNSWDAGNWSSVTGFILSGGTAATAGGIALFSTLSYYGAAGSIFLLLPSLVSGLMAVIVALVIIAGRQALITILAIISPLAFVAYLLPNTEKLFEKWRSTFLTLLIVFPAFSVIFGGAQLAGTAIIQNASSINAIILGMLVQVFPLFITPMLIKLSGSTLAGLANIINNPNRGLIDRTRKFTEDRAENIKARRLAKNPIRRGQFLLRNAQRMDHNRRRREYNRDTNNTTTDARWYNSRDYRDIDQRMRKATESKAIGETKSEVRYLRSNTHQNLATKSYEVSLDKQTAEQNVSHYINQEIRTSETLMTKEMTMRKAVDTANTSKAAIDKINEEFRAGINNTGFANMQQLADEYNIVTRDFALTSIATQRAKHRQQTQLSDSLLKNIDVIEGQNLRTYAAGIDAGHGGEEAALAYAVAVRREADAKVINERSQLIKQFNLSGLERQSLATGKKRDPITGGLIDITSVRKSYQMADGTQVNYDFDVNDDFMREAAIETQMAIGSFDDIRTIVEMSGSELKKYITTISDGVAKNKIGSRGLFLGGKTIDDISQGKITNHNDLIEITAKFIRDGKAKPEELAGNDAEAIAVFIEAVRTGHRFMTSQVDRTKFDGGVLRLKAAADQILNSELLGRNATDATKEQLDILRNL